MKPIPYGRQHVTDEDIEAVAQVLRDDYLTGGPRISAFESAFASYVGAQFAVAVSSGTAALHLSAIALGVKPGSRIISTPLTFVASTNCVLYCGGEVDLVDIDPVTLTIDIDQVEALLSTSPAGTYQGIIPVDFAGQAVNLERLRKIANSHGCWLLEDACHAPGGYFMDQFGNRNMCGNGEYADLSIFSFHPVKHIASGEGGMITTNDKALYDQLLTLRNHGITRSPERLSHQPGGWYYEMQHLGFNYRLTDIQAALGLSQLKRANTSLEKRKQLAERYDRAFADSAVHPQQAQAGHAYHLYVVQVPGRKALYDYLRSKQIYTQIHYIPVHYQPYYQQLGFKRGDFPHTEAYYDQCLSLPLFPTLTDAEQDYVIQHVLKGLDSLSQP